MEEVYKKIIEEAEESNKISRILNAIYNKPNSYETKIIKICLKYQWPFLFTGNGTFYVERKNPDFKHCFKNILIEVFNSHMHEVNYIQNKQQFYQEKGFRCIFVDENDILSKNWEVLIFNKINDFMKQFDEEKKIQEATTKNPNMLFKKPSKPEITSQKIITWITEKNIETFNKKILMNEFQQICGDTLSKSLHILKLKNKITVEGIGKKTTYKIIKQTSTTN